MSERICDCCGKKKSVAGGKTCEKGHFVCQSCTNSGGVFSFPRTQCPICKKPLR
jgi:hypothetical protein